MGMIGSTEIVRLTNKRLHSIRLEVLKEWHRKGFCTVIIYAWGRGVSVAFLTVSFSYSF